MRKTVKLDTPRQALFLKQTSLWEQANFMSEQLGTLASRVYSVVYHLPKGRVCTYATIGKVIGSRAYQAIGQALAKNPHAPLVPCHRVIRSDRRLGGFRASTQSANVELKRQLLASEGVFCLQDGRIKRDEILNLQELKRIIASPNC